MYFSCKFSLFRMQSACIFCFPRLANSMHFAFFPAGPQMYLIESLLPMKLLQLFVTISSSQSDLGTRGFPQYKMHQPLQMNPSK